MTPFVWSQIVAAGAFACGMTSYQFRERRTVLFWLTGLALLNGCHFVLLDRTTPAVMMLLTAVRYVAAIYSRQRWLLYLFLIAAIGSIALTYSGPLSWLALGGVLCGTVGSFQASDRLMRRCFMTGNCCWLAHNLFAQTPVATLMEASFLTSNVIGYWRFYRKPSVCAAADESLSE
jgi:Bacterial inner membrane protein